VKEGTDERRKGRVKKGGKSLMGCRSEEKKK
jgi:hypothetical protein